MLSLLGYAYTFMFSIRVHFLYIVTYIHIEIYDKVHKGEDLGLDPFQDYFNYFYLIFWISLL